MSYDIFLSAPTDDVVPVADVLSLLGERVDARRTAIVTANGSASFTASTAKQPTASW